MALNKMSKNATVELYNRSLIYIYLALTPEIGQGVGRILICGARKPEQT